MKFSFRNSLIVSSTSLTPDPEPKMNVKITSHLISCFTTFWKCTYLDFQSLNHSTSTIDQLEQTEGGKCQIGSLNWVFSVATMTMTLKISDVAKINTHYKFAQKSTKNGQIHPRYNKGRTAIFGKIKLLFSRMSFCALQRLHFMYVRL